MEFVIVSPNATQKGIDLPGDVYIIFFVPNDVIIPLPPPLTQYTLGSLQGNGFD
tara:strand:- start:393 stop:554 length:162 start_codon:yes stop_codon:yes gene_type:complete